MKMTLMPLWILLAVALILVGCSGWPIGRTAEEQTHDSPDVVVQRFYTWYLDDSQAEPKDALQSGVLSEELSARMKSALPGNSVNSFAPRTSRRASRSAWQVSKETRLPFLWRPAGAVGCRSASNRSRGPG
jgi:hypothetical protein